MHSEDLKHIKTQNPICIDWEKNQGVVPKPGNGLESYQSSATAIAMAERERVAKRNAEEAFDEVYSETGYNAPNFLIFSIKLLISIEIKK